MNSSPERARRSRPCRASPPARSGSRQPRPRTRSPASPTNARGLPGECHQPRHRHRRARRAQGAPHGPFGGRPAGDREARRRAPGSASRPSTPQARRGRAHRPRRRAHGARDRRRRLRVSLWRRRAPEFRTGPGATRPTWSRRTPAPSSRSRACSRSSTRSRHARTPRPISRASRPMPASSTARPGG